MSRACKPTPLKVSRAEMMQEQKWHTHTLYSYMHEECACVVSIPASSPPWKPSVGLACMHCSYSNSGAPGAAASEHLAVEPLAAVDHHGFTSMRDTAIPQKQLLSSPDAGLWIFVVSKAS